MAEAEDSENTNNMPPVLHVVVVGFHHKRGCQVDYSYPPLIDGQPNTSNEIPEEWKHLPFLALPDGAHNYKEDTIYFHLPGKGNCKDTVYGVSCYRQIDTKDLKSQQAEYTRGTVQKSVCVLSTLFRSNSLVVGNLTGSSPVGSFGGLEQRIEDVTKCPLYGLIQAKLKLITHAYFGERDFSQTAILEDLYKSLNLSLHKRLLDDSQVFLGLDLRELVLRFKHKILVIFKLMMLERRVLFFCSPAEQLCSSVLSFVSLFPGMLQNGLTEAACYRYYKPTTPSLVLEDFGIDTKEYMNIDMSHVPNYNRRRKSPFRGKVRPSQTSKIDVTDTTDESSAGTLPSRSPPPLPQDNVNTNSNGGHNGVMDFDHQDGKDMEADLLTSAANVAVSRRSFSKTGEQSNGSLEEQSRITADNEKRHQGPLNNNKSIDAHITQTSNGGTKFSRNTGSKYSRKSARNSHYRKSARTNMDEEDAFADYDNISAHSSESIDVNARINAYFDTLSKKHHDSSVSISSGSLNSYDPSSSHDDFATSSMLSETGTSSRFSEFSMISSDVSVSSKSLDKTADSVDKFPTVKVLEDELLNMIDQELYGPYFDNHRFSMMSTGLSNTMDSEGALKPKRNSIDSSQTMSDYAECDTPLGSIRNSTAGDYSGSEARHSMHSVMDDFVVLPNTPAPTELETDDFGFPLALFGKGALCHPYISLQQHDLLQDVNVRCFVIGASNALFKHQRHLVDVLVEVNEGKVLVYDHEVRRQLHLSTADLRFADFLVKNVADESEDVFLDQTGWEGGDEWIRAQFKVYLLSLLATTAHGNSDQEADFNDNWVRAWKTTHNYRIWKSQVYENIDYIHPGHPFTGGLGVSDMKIKLQSAMQTTDRGKKINTAISKTSEAVYHTSKAVGGALTSAKSAVSSWFSSFAGGEWKIDEEETVVKKEEENRKQEEEAFAKKEEEIKKQEEEMKKLQKELNDEMQQSEPEEVVQVVRKDDERSEDKGVKEDVKAKNENSEKEAQEKEAMENIENEMKKDEEDMQKVDESGEKDKMGDESQVPELECPELPDTEVDHLQLPQFSEEEGAGQDEPGKSRGLMANLEEQWDLRRSRMEGDEDEEEEDMVEEMKVRKDVEEGKNDVEEGKKDEVEDKKEEEEEEEEDDDDDYL